MIPKSRFLFVLCAGSVTSSLEAAMIDRLWKPRWRLSIFSKLLAIMLGVIALLLLMVTGFFALVVFPSTLSSSEHAVEEYTRVLAASSPNYESAKNIRKQVNLDIRYE